MRYITLAALLFLLLQVRAGVAEEAALAQALNDLDASLQTSTISESAADVRGYEIGLGALQKVGGSWRFKASERFSGHLSTRTWQIANGFSSQEVLDALEAALADLEGAQLLFACDGRACGHASQWANRVFRERELYGRADLQRYRVYAVSDDAEARLVLYASVRTADRQYLRADLLVLSEQEQ